MNITQERIKEAIKNSGLSYRELGEKIGISSTSIYRYVQKSVDKIPLFVIEKIANVTNTDVKWLMGWDEQEEKTVSPEKQSFINKIINMDEETFNRYSQLLELFDAQRNQGKD